MSMPKGSFDPMVVAAHRGKAPDQLPGLDVDAPNGVSTGDVLSECWGKRVGRLVAHSLGGRVCRPA